MSLWFWTRLAKWSEPGVHQLLPMRACIRTSQNSKNKLARLLFDFGVANTTDDDCEQQVPNVALRLQKLTTSTVVLGLQQPLSDAKSNLSPY